MAAVTARWAIRQSASTAISAGRCSIRSRCRSPITRTSAAFYRLLGLRQIVESAPRYARFESAGGATLSIETADEIAGKPVVFLECGDLEGLVMRLREAGIAVSDPVLEDWGWREARLADPAGNAICLYQAGENRRFPPWRLP